MRTHQWQSRYFRMDVSTLTKLFSKQKTTDNNRNSQRKPKNLSECLVDKKAYTSNVLTIHPTFPPPSFHFTSLENLLAKNNNMTVILFQLLRHRHRNPSAKIIPIRWPILKYIVSKTRENQWCELNSKSNRPLKNNQNISFSYGPLVHGLVIVRKEIKKLSYLKICVSMFFVLVISDVMLLFTSYTIQLYNLLTYRACEME